MAESKVFVTIKSGMEGEDAYFREQDKKLIRERRIRAVEESNETYCEEHKNHCFRCGTESLIEVNRADIKIDICVNENCGAVHLDPGELERILKAEKAIGIIRKSVLAVFKK